ncbi:hypothetical protein NEMIN01_0898 [Nematocida minor]|uniref:uncharacterized protein n=1 Tax=Nematocida minor TaxID=1912983 RepID=UPI0022200977|nr:uncharacterized protein NEMIN01_0898 [Nematocida minor]KAI5190199.1 hypothetical protein NEMIN01_0898 [Nematocida minor]
MLTLAANVSRALKNAVKEYLAFAGCMSTAEARQILKITETAPLTYYTITAQKNKLKSKNEPILPLSAYILKKIESAEKVLLREIE